ncbi:hypothetical protein [uncultured Methylobacterium sp.]|uniref:hypothetical protein n=1 Tax=uncultured Methylobacterium sp. TaxID=157278 RepID=UPI0035CB4938
MSKMPPSDDDADWLAQISKPFPDNVNGDIVVMFRAWALMEAALTMWLIALMGVDDDVGRLVVDRFDTRTKISRIREIYDHFQNDDMTKTVKEVSYNYEKWVETRNIVAHKVCFGMSEDGTHLMFATGKYTRRKRDEFTMVGIALPDLRRCAQFAIGMAGDIQRGLPAIKVPG